MKRTAAAMVFLVPLWTTGQEETRGPSEPSFDEGRVRPSVESTPAEEEPYVMPGLPTWEREDQKLLNEGGIVPGEALLSETLGDLVLPPPPPVPVPPPEIITPGTERPAAESFPDVIGEEYVDEYFGQRPVTFLNDPQELLSRQEFRDRESFLQYHAGDSEVDLYIHLFDARQELPEGVSIERVFEQHFKGRGGTALVFYYFGMPERSQIVLSKEITNVVSLDEQQRALRNAIQEAFEKSDPAYQLDNFAVELSIRLYWFEKAMSGADEAPAVASASGEGDLSLALERAGLERPERTWLKPVATVLGILVGAGGLGFLGRWLADRHLRYLFPEVDSATLLGAPHAAGVGAVVSFGSAQLPAAQQRDQVPDYLQRM